MTALLLNETKSAVKFLRVLLIMASYVVRAIFSINVCSRLFRHSNRRGHDRGGDHVRDDGDARHNRNHGLLHRCHDDDHRSNRLPGEYDRGRFLLTWLRALQQLQR